MKNSFSIISKRLLAVSIEIAQNEDATFIVPAT